MSKKEYIVLPLILICSFFYLAAFCKYGINPADEGIPFSGALRIMKGEVPLKDFQGYMPGKYYFYYAILKIFGSDILTVRYVISFITAIMVCVCYALSRKIMAVNYSLFAALTILAVPGTYYGRFLSFFITANIAFFYVFTMSKSFAPFFMGIIGGITLLFRQDLGLFVFSLAIFMFLVEKYFSGDSSYAKAISGIKQYVTGYFTIIFLPVFYYIYVGKFLYILKLNYNGFFGDYQKMNLPFPDLSSDWHEIGLFYIPVLIYLYTAFHIIIGMKNKHGKQFMFKLYILLIGILSFNQAIWRTHPENIIRVIIPAVILYFYLFQIGYERLKRKALIQWIFIMIFSLIPISYAYAINKNYGTHIGSINFSTSKYKPFGIERANVFAPEQFINDYKKLVTYIKNNTAPDEKIYIVPFWGIPLYFLSNRTNPTYFEWVLLADMSAYPNIEELIIESLIKDKTRIIIYVDFPLDGLEERRFKNYAPKLYKWMMDNYFYEDIIGGYRILKINSSEKPKSLFDYDYEYEGKEIFGNKFVNYRGMNINGDRRFALFEHPKSSIKYKIRVPENSLLNFGIALDQRVWDKNKGDGVYFEIIINDGGVEDVLFSQYINPKSNIHERKWIDHSIDLSDYGSKEVLLILNTLPGPAGNNAYDWAGWSKLEFITKYNDGFRSK